MQNQLLTEQLGKTKCPICKGSLEDAKIVPITNAQVAILAHAVCPHCHAQSMITVTAAGSGAMPITSDLKSHEVQKFIGFSKTTINDVLDLHLLLKKEKIWNLLPKKETN